MGTGKGADNKAGYRNVSWHPDLSPQFEAVSLDGKLPFMEVKVFYVLSDLSESNSGNLWMVPGSHLRAPQELRDMQRQVDPDQAVELRLRQGGSSVAHGRLALCRPQSINKTRKIMHVGYHHRWLRPTDYVEQDAALVAASSPIRRQLLGALATGGDPLGENADIGAKFSILATPQSR